MSIFFTIFLFTILANDLFATDLTIDCHDFSYQIKKYSLHVKYFDQKSDLSHTNLHYVSFNLILTKKGDPEQVLDLSQFILKGDRGDFPWSSGLKLISNKKTELNILFVIPDYMKTIGLKLPGEVIFHLEKPGE